MKKVLLIGWSIILLISTQSLFAQKVKERSSNPAFIVYDGTQAVSIGQHASLIENYQGRGSNIQVVVQDILIDSNYSTANKGLTNSSTVIISPGIEGAVLFNLDIYGYDTINGDPKDNINNRIQYDYNMHLGEPVVIRINRAQVKKLIKEQYGINVANPTRLDLYFYEPLEDRWLSIDELVDRGDISYEIYGANLIITVYKWPKDDRLHVGA